MCLLGMVVGRNQSHLFDGAIRLVDLQDKLLISTMSGPNHDLGFGLILRGAFEGLGFQIKSSLHRISLWYIVDESFCTAPSAYSLGAQVPLE